MIDVTGGHPMVVMRAGQQTFALNVFRDRFGGTYGQLLFGTYDCSGTPYIEQLSVPALLAAAFVTNDGTLYVAPENTSGSTVSVSCIMFEGENFPGASVCYSFDPSDTQVVEAQAVANLPSMFLPPYVLK